MKKSLHQADSFFIPSSLWHSCGLFIRFPPQENLQAEQPVQPPQLLYFPAFLRRIIILTAATIAPAIRIRSTIEAKFIFSPLLACILCLHPAANPVSDCSTQPGYHALKDHYQCSPSASKFSFYRCDRRNTWRIQQAENQKCCCRNRSQQRCDRGAIRQNR